MTFEEYVQKNLCKPFVWGEHDCITFAIGWLNIKANRNFLQGLPTWSTASEALRVIQSVGGLEHMFNTHLKIVSPNFARNGDIALIDRTVFLFCGARIVGPGEEGLVFIDRTKASCAWSL